MSCIVHLCSISVCLYNWISICTVVTQHTVAWFSFHQRSFLSLSPKIKTKKPSDCFRLQCWVDLYLTVVSVVMKKQFQVEYWYSISLSQKPCSSFRADISGSDIGFCTLHPHPAMKLLSLKYSRVERQPLYFLLTKG